MDQYSSPNNEKRIGIRLELQDPTSYVNGPHPTTLSVNPRHQVRFRHPHYPEASNVLLTLFAPDTSTGGIEYGVAHAACGVVSGNRWEGWFTTTADGAASTLTYGAILCERDYYFHLPESTFESPYSVVPTFTEWDFPHRKLHPCWQIEEDHIPVARSRLQAASSLSSAIILRDQSCRMSSCEEGTQAAHLCPRSEISWFQRNGMSRYNLNPLLVATEPIDDTANAILLRQDLHTLFDSRKFVFVPKARTKEERSVVTHLLIPSRELGLIYHNRRLKPIPDVDIAFLFTRFAWTIFPLLAGFLNAGVSRRLTGQSISAQAGIPQMVSADDCGNLALGSKSKNKSRSQSPKKRSRRGSDAEGENDMDSRRYKRQKMKAKTAFTIDKISDGTESSDEVTTPSSPVTTIDALKNDLLKRERLQSDPTGTWLEEVAWATQMRSGDQVMNPAQASRLFNVYGSDQTITHEAFNIQNG